MARMSFCRSLFAAVALAATAITTATFYFVVDTCRTTANWVADHILSAARLAPTEAGKVAKQPERMQRVAKAYASTLVRRERVRIESNFRMCPSV